MFITPVKCRWLVALVMVSGTFCTALWAQVQAVSQKPSAPNPPHQSAPLTAVARARIRHAVEAVGLIFVRNTYDKLLPRPRGSGVIIRSDGILVTNAHVINDTNS